MILLIKNIGLVILLILGFTILFLTLIISIYIISTVISGLLKKE